MGVRHLLDFKPDIVAAVVFLLLLVLGPLCVFAPRLARAKRQGFLEYGALASRYVDGFDRNGCAAHRRKMSLWSVAGIFKRLNDLAGSFEVVNSMRPFPFEQDRLYCKPLSRRFYRCCHWP